MPRATKCEIGSRPRQGSPVPTEDSLPISGQSTRTSRLSSDGAPELMPSPAHETQPKHIDARFAVGPNRADRSTVGPQRRVGVALPGHDRAVNLPPPISVARETVPPPPPPATSPTSEALMRKRCDMLLKAKAKATTSRQLHSSSPAAVAARSSPRFGDVRGALSWASAVVSATEANAGAVSAFFAYHDTLGCAEEGLLCELKNRAAAAGCRHSRVRVVCVIAEAWLLVLPPPPSVSDGLRGRLMGVLNDLAANTASSTATPSPSGLSSARIHKATRAALEPTGGRSPAVRRLSAVNWHAGQSQLLSEMLTLALAPAMSPALARRLGVVVGRRASSGDPLASSRAAELWVSLPPALLAEQLTIVSFYLGRRVPCRELLNKKARHFRDALREAAGWFEHVANHVASAVLAPAAPKHRAAAIATLIEAAQRAVELRNYDALAAVIAGLTSSPVARLAKTWALVDDKVHATMYLLAESCAHSARGLKESMKAAAAGGAPLVPFFGCLLQEADQVCELPWISSASNSINVCKLKKLGAILDTLGVSRCFEINREVSGQVLRLFSAQPLWTPDEAMDRSRALEASVKKGFPRRRPNTS